MGKRIAENDNTTIESKRSMVLTNFHLNEKYHNEAEKQRIKRNLKEGDPFPYIHLENFVGDQARSIKDLEKELKNMEWNRRENDLYSLSQTVDLRSLKPSIAPSLYSFRRFLVTKVHAWLSDVSGVELTSQVDSTGSVYTSHDGLQPHSDLIGTRHYAFVYYLTDKNWNESDGGYLHLYTANENHEPVDIVKSLKPLRNSMVIFEVSADSWHRVGEVLSSKGRLSINGWFHSTRKLSPPPVTILQLQRSLPHSKDVDLCDLVTEEYQKPNMVAQAKLFFNEESEIMINDFVEKSLNDSVYKSLTKSKFELFGPPSKRHLMRVKVNSLKGSALSLYSILSSSSFALYLTHITGIELDECSLSLQINRLETGSYSVSGDEELEQSEKEGFCLECNVFIGGPKWNEDAGGDIVYAGKGDTQELIRVQPNGRSLALVLREPNVYSFFKYINSSATSPIYCYSLTYYNVPMDDNDEDVVEIDQNEEDSDQ